MGKVAQGHLRVDSTEISRHHRRNSASSSPWRLGLRSSSPSDPVSATVVAHLLEEFGAMVTSGEMRLEPATVSPRKGHLEVVGDQLDHLLAGKATPSERPQAPPSPNSASRAPRRRLRARCKRTRWWPSCRPRIWQASAAVNPSTSRSVSTSR